MVMSYPTSMFFQFLLAGWEALRFSSSHHRFCIFFLKSWKIVVGFWSWDTWVGHPSLYFSWPTKLTSKFSGCTHVPSYLPEFVSTIVTSHAATTCEVAPSCYFFDKFGCHFGPLYTMSQGQCSTQIKHSYWCKSWNWPQGVHTRNQGLNRKKKNSICPKLLINAELYGLVLASRLEKGYHWIWEANLQPLGGPMFQHLLISWCQCSSLY